ncbi:hypothetical protein NECAME_14155 [Necator americanus]|uniref:Uncharacterized protein n=1 Tax=Necator americanus TaxID=51031 RepID=W2SQ34_NECAM|nr:hypothetical protein NECAME_14155 [Necator americanus]ETN71638.1 hypothetical protein NECAME_14155 [Necator americanus]
MGCSAIDLVRLFCSCLSGKDRQEHWEQLLEEIYNYLREEAGDIEIPYTLDQLKESYRRFLPLGAFIVLTMIPLLIESVNKISDEEEKRKNMDAAMEKTECLLDDILHYHERNMKLRKGDQDV